MTERAAGGARAALRWSLVLGVVAVAGVVAGLAASWRGAEAVGSGLLAAAWLLPGLVALHLGQLFMAGVSWRLLFVRPGPGLGTFYRLRIVREGVDSLLPVAQIGGEVVGTRLLAQAGVPLPRAAASVIADVTIELLTQVAFLLVGLALLARGADGVAWRHWLAALLAGGVATALLVSAQRFGALRVLEGLLRGMARRWPALAGASLDGIHAEAIGFGRNRAGLAGSMALHLTAWTLGSVETWAVLHVLGVPVSPAEAMIVESLGMAGRSAGFAIPAALGAQESGFVLAGAAIGVSATPALTLSLVKRMREILVGSVGLVLWRLAVHGAARASARLEGAGRR